jgi:hypothetical protein
MPLVVPRSLKTGRGNPDLLDRIETLIRRLHLDRYFLGCQMHLLEKPN